MPAVVVVRETPEGIETSPEMHSQDELRDYLKALPWDTVLIRTFPGDPLPEIQNNQIVLEIRRPGKFYCFIKRPE